MSGRPRTEEPRRGPAIRLDLASLCGVPELVELDTLSIVDEHESLDEARAMRGELLAAGEVLWKEAR